MKKLLSLLIMIMVFPIVTRAYGCTGYAFGFDDGETEVCFSEAGSSQFDRALTKSGTVFVNYDVEKLSIIVSGGITVNIDLNGHSVEDMHLAQSGNKGHIYKVYNSQDTESSITKLSITGSEVSSDKLTNVWVTGIKFNGYISVAYDTALTLNDCFTETMAARPEAVFIENAGTININSGEYDISKKINNSGNMIINGGSFNGDLFINTNSSDSIATLTINGGTFTANNLDSNNYMFRNLSSIGATTKSVLNINGGTFKSTKNDYIFDNNYGTVNISGGQTNATKSPLFKSQSGIVNMNGGTYSTETSEQAIDFRTSTFSFTGGIIDAKKSLGMKFTIFNFGSTGTTYPILYLNKGTLVLDEDNPLKWKNGVMYLPDDTVKDSDAVTLTSDNYEIRSKKQSDGSYINFLALKTADADYFPAGITDDPYVDPTNPGTDPQEPDPQDPTPQEPEPKVYIVGDWNNDGDYNIADVICYRKYLANAEEPISIDGEEKLYEGFEDERKQALDLSNPKDGNITLQDLVIARLTVH